MWIRTDGIIFANSWTVRYRRFLVQLVQVHQKPLHDDISLQWGQIIQLRPIEQLIRTRQTISLGTLVQEGLAFLAPYGWGWWAALLLGLSQRLALIECLLYALVGVALAREPKSSLSLTKWQTNHAENQDELRVVLLNLHCNSSENCCVHQARLTTTFHGHSRM
jgi:hypothetical protein